MSRRGIAVLALRAWALGLLIAGIVLFPLNLLGGFGAGDPALLAWLVSLPTALAGVFTAGALLSLPLFLLALGIALAFRERIARAPWGFIAAAVALGLLIAVLDYGFLRGPPWAEATPLGRRLLAGLFSREAAFFGLSIGAGAGYFCLTLAGQGSDSQSGTPPGSAGRK